MTTTTREWSGLTLETSVQYGVAARMNRGRYSGTTIHALFVEKIIASVEPRTPGRLYVGDTFSTYPFCGVTMGQHAGRALPGLTQENVTCKNCRRQLGLDK